MNASVTFIPTQLNIEFAQPTLGASTGTPVAREYVGGEPYTGEYEVQPSFENQTLLTAHKLLARNVTVEAIEVSTVSNPSGGNTVYIGGIF